MEQGARLIGYSLNQGMAALAQYVSVEQLYERFYRPDLLIAKLHGDPAKLLQQKGALIDVDTVLPSSVPPQVAIVQPTPDLTTVQREVEVQIMLTDQGGGLGKIVWSIDGVTVGVTRASSPQAGRDRRYRRRNASCSRPAPTPSLWSPMTSVIWSPQPQRRSPSIWPRHRQPLTLHTPKPRPPAAGDLCDPGHRHHRHATEYRHPGYPHRSRGRDWQGPLDAQCGAGCHRDRARTPVNRAGQETGHTHDGHHPSEPGKQRLTKSFVLTPGTNTITVVAYTRDNAVASPPAVRTVQFATAPTAVVSSATPPVPDAPTPLHPARLVYAGCRYQSLSRQGVMAAVRRPDGQELAQRRAPGRLPLVRDVKVTTLFDEQATMAELEAAFARVAAQTSTMIFFCSIWQDMASRSMAGITLFPRTFTIRIRMPCATVLLPRTICSAGSPCPGTEEYHPH